MAGALPGHCPCVSDTVEKGAVKKLWHLHDTVDLFSLICSQFEITGHSAQESLKNFTPAKGCLVMADRAYGTIKARGSPPQAEYPAKPDTFFILYFDICHSMLTGMLWNV